MHLSTLLAEAGPESTARDLLLILATAGLVGLLLRRIHIATIPGYLIAGAVVGPGLGLVRDSESIASISQLAIILLLFTIGLHLDPQAAGLNRRRLRLLGPVVLTGVIATLGFTLIGWPVAMAFGLSVPAALAVAMALSMSSTAAVLRVLQQRHELSRSHGRLSFGILLIQDLLALGFLASMPVLAVFVRGVEPDGADSRTSDLLLDGAVAIGGITILLLVGRRLLPRLLREAARTSPDEVLLIISAAMALGAAVLTGALGFSPELGAFLAGFLLAGTPFKHHLSGQLAPMRDLFMAVFFTAVGLSLPLAPILHGWWIVLLATGVLLALKGPLITTTAWLAGMPESASVRAGMALAHGGEFSLIILTQAVGAGVLSAERSAYAVATVVLSLIVAPLLMDLSGPLAVRVRGMTARSRWGGPPEAGVIRDGRPEGVGPGPAAIIAGFGPVGRAVAERLERAGMSITVIELNPRTVQRQSTLGRTTCYGDASNPEVLESAGVARADAVILTMPDEEAVIRACRIIRALRPDIFISARANVLSKAMQAMQLGANHVVVEEIATAEAMAAQIMARLADRPRRAAGS